VEDFLSALGNTDPMRTRLDPENLLLGRPRRAKLHPA
jgi:hypothetical protein